MNKTAIQKFAVWARTELIAQVAQRAYQYGVTAGECAGAGAEILGGRALTRDEFLQRQGLLQEVEETGRTLKELGLTIRTFYMGGGTPTTLSAGQMDRLLTQCEECLPLEGCTEYTVEAGPTPSPGKSWRY